MDLNQIVPGEDLWEVIVFSRCFYEWARERVVVKIPLCPVKTCENRREFRTSEMTIFRVRVRHLKRKQ